MDAIAAGWQSLENGLLAHLIVPLLALTGLAGAVQNPRDIAQFLMINLIQISVIALLFRPLESLVPAEQWADRKLTRVDIVYTVLKGLGLVPLFSFVMLAPLGHWLGDFGGLIDTGDTSRIAQWFPWFSTHPILLFAVYFVLLDFVAYWVHRLQHKLPFWWAMHSLHHSQRQLSCWSNDRSHILDDGIEAVITALTSLMIGVPPGQYAALILAGTLVENFSHANVALRFGRVLDKLLVDPRFHRTHHILAPPDQPHLHDCNYALVLPVWDILFGTARYNLVAEKTGVTDPGIDADNTKFWLGQQIAGFRRLRRALGVLAG